MIDVADDAQFETVKSEKKDFGKNNFIEVARKKVTSDKGSTEFVTISRGYYLPDGAERYKKSVTVPDVAEIKEFVAEMLKKI